MLIKLNWYAMISEKIQDTSNKARGVSHACAGFSAFIETDISKHEVEVVQTFKEEIKIRSGC